MQNLRAGSHEPRLVGSDPPDRYQSLPRGGRSTWTSARGQIVAGSSPSHWVHCFGGPAVRVNGRRLSLSTQQAELISVLAAAPAPEVSRDEITTLLWREGTDGQLRRRLNQLLYSLNRKSGARRIVQGDGKRVKLIEGVTGRDLDGLLESVRRGSLREASPILEEGFLPDAPPPSTWELETWLEKREGEIRRELREAVTVRWEQADRQGDRSEAEAASRVLLSLDPHDEEALQLHLRSLAGLGRVEEARVAYRSFEERIRVLLDGESWKPEPETQAVVEGLEELVPPAVPGSDISRPEIPFVGRRSELRRLREVIQRPGRDAVTTVIVSGEAGVGKSRLLDEALRDAPGLGLRILKGEGEEFGRGIPLNGILQALSPRELAPWIRSLDEPWKTVVLGLLPHFREGPGQVPEAPTIEPGRVPRRMFEALTRLLQAFARERPTLLVLDDFHWSDETSLAALDYIRRRWNEGSLTLILGLRPEAVPPQSTLARFLSELGVRAEDASVHLELEELDPNSADELIREAAPEELDETDRRRIAALGGRSPFFLLELTVEWAAGRVHALDDLVEEGPVQLPLSIRQLLDQRLREVPPRAELLLGTLAIHGQPIRPSELPDLTDLTAVQAMEGIRLLKRLHLLRTNDTGDLMVQHDLVRQETYRRLQPQERAFLHHRIAHFLLRKGDATEVDDLAFHFHRAGDQERALEYACQAADRAERAGATSEAIAYLEIARKNVVQDDLSAEITRRLALLHYMKRDFEKAPPVLQLAQEQLRTQGRIADALSTEVKRLDTLSHSEELPLDECLNELERVKEEARREAHLHVLAEALDVEIRHYHRTGNVPRAQQVIAAASELVQADCPRAKCAALCIVSLESHYGSLARALQAAPEAVSIARSNDFPNLYLRALNRHLVALLHSGTLGSSVGDKVVSEAREASHRSGDLLSRFYIEMNQGVWYLRTERHIYALDSIGRAQALIQDSSDRDARLLLMYNKAVIQLRHGETVEASQGFGRALDLLQDRSPVHLRWLTWAGIGHCALYQGQLQYANQVAQEAIEIPDYWYFDPSLITQFVHKLFSIQGRCDQALRLLRTTSHQLRTRMPTSWLEVKLQECELLAKTGLGSPQEPAREALQVIAPLGMPHKAKVFRRFL